MQSLYYTSNFLNFLFTIYREKNWPVDMTKLACSRSPTIIPCMHVNITRSTATIILWYLCACVHVASTVNGFAIGIWSIFGDTVLLVNVMDMHKLVCSDDVMQSKSMQLWIYPISGIIQPPAFSDSRVFCTLKEKKKWLFLSYFTWDCCEEDRANRADKGD